MPAQRLDQYLQQCDAADYVPPEPLHGILFGLSYNTMPHHRAVLRHAWQLLRPGGRIVIMDGKLPRGLGGKLVLPFGLWLMKHTMLGNPTKFSSQNEPLLTWLGQLVHDDPAWTSHKP